MKKTIRAIVALIATLGMALAGFVGTSTALAEDSTGSIIIKNTVAGDEFSLYRIAGIKSDADCQSNKDPVTAHTDTALLDSNETSKCKVVYELIDDTDMNTALNQALIKAVKAATNQDVTTSTELLAALTTKLKSGNIDAFAKAFSNEYSGKGIEVIVGTNGSVVTDDPDSKVTESTTTGTVDGKEINVTTIDGLTPGYYLIVQDMMTTAETTDKPAEERTKSYNMVGTVLKGKTFTFKLKNGTVQLTKDIVDGDNTTDEGVKYAVGDDVTFSLTGTMPDNYAQFTVFTYKFTDTLPAGLDYNADEPLTVTIGGKTLADASTVTNVTDKDITVNLGDLKSEDYKEFGITKDTEIVVTYKATVNENAVYKNENKATITFNNNPNVETTDDVEEITTPEDKSTVFNLTLNVNKTDGNGNALDGAKFTLTRLGDAPDKDDYTANVWKSVEAKGNDTKTASFPGLGEGKYRLEETVTPEGYNTIDPIIFVVKAVKDDTSEKVTGFEIVDEDGNSIVDEKNKNLFPVVIPTKDETTTVATSTTIVVNKAGSELPSTGGMGTVLLYTVGGLVVLIAAAGLTIALKRRQN